MAKGKKNKKAEKSIKAPKPERKGKSKKTSGGVAKLAAKAGKIATAVAVEEIVAATLVAAAAAIRDPKKARAMASAAGNELKALTNEAAREGSALWRLALDIGRSVAPVAAKGAESPTVRLKPAKPAVRKKRSVK